jgi:hypothetical protein
MIHSIGHHGGESAPFQAAHGSRAEMRIESRAPAETEFAQFEQLFPDGSDIGFVRGQGFSEGDCHIVWNTWQLSEKLSAFVGKDGTPQLIHPHRNHLRLGVSGNQFVATLQPQECPGTAQLAFREETDDVTGSNGVSRSS